MLDEIDAKGTQVDIVLNNAAVQIAYRVDYFKTPVEDFSDSFVINTIAPSVICYHFLPKMIERGFGRIVNTTSGIRLEPEQAGYSASKAALDKFTIDIGSKLQGTDVMVNLADPGWCRTDLGGASAPNAPESVIPGIVIGVFADDKKKRTLLWRTKFCGNVIGRRRKKGRSARKSVLKPPGHFQNVKLIEPLRKLDNVADLRGNFLQDKEAVMRRTRTCARNSRRSIAAKIPR